MDEISVTVGENIRRFRRRKDYSQEYVAAVLEISLSKYARMEKGLSPVNAVQLKRLSELLEVSLGDLFGIENVTQEVR